MPSHSGSCHHLGPYSEKKRTENKISHWIVWGIFAVQTKENPAKASLVFPVSSCHTYPYEERHLTFVFTPTPCVWYSLIHSLLNLCMHTVCVCVCSCVSLKMDTCCYMGMVEVRGQPQVPFLTFHLVWDEVSCWSYWVPQAVWPKSFWGFYCLGLSLCKSIGIIEGTLVHGFSRIFWKSKGRISH